MCAVSGGSDSMCLLHALRSMESQLKISVYAAHYEHGIRGSESLRDCAFVENWCSQEHIPFLCEHGNVPEYAAEKKIGLEEAARDLRYAFLERARTELNCDVIATAHNMDDNAETVLFHLARGTGSSGLSGIPPVRGRIVRPLLCMTRLEIEQYLADNRIPHVEDSTNASDDCSRNLIRHNVLPELNRISGKTVESIFRTSALIREDDEFLQTLAKRFVDDGAAAASLPRDALLEQPRAIASRAVRIMYERTAGRTLSFEHTESVLELAKSSERKSLSLPGGTIVFEQGMLYFHGLNDESDSTEQRNAGNQIPDSCKIVPGQTVSFKNGVRISSEECFYSGEVNDLFNTFYLKYDEIRGTVFCTGRLPGDSLRVLGRQCTKSLKSLFLETKMTQAERDSILIFRDDAGVLAAEGLAFSERMAVAKGDKALKITIDRKQKEQ